MDDDPISGLHFQIKQTSRKKSYSSSSTHIFPTLSPELCRTRQEPSSLLPHLLWNTWVCPWRQLLRNNTFTFLNPLKTFPRAEVLKCLWSKLISPNPVDQYTLWVILLLLDNNLCTSLFPTPPDDPSRSSLPRYPWKSHFLFLCFPHRKNLSWLALPDLLLSTYNKTSQFSCVQRIYHIIYVKEQLRVCFSLTLSNMSYIPV